MTLDTFVKAVILAFGILGGCISTASGAGAFLTYVEGRYYGVLDSELRPELSHAVDYGVLEGFIYGLPLSLYSFFLASAGVLDA